ncbi:MAG: hypothetical protein ABJA87_03270 [bacterium]
MSAVALVTCAELPEGDDDGAVLAEACADAGVNPAWVVWDDPTVDWADWDLVVVRSTWDYTTRREEFVRWARRVPRLVNPADVIAWNSDKTYLRDLAAAGVAVVATTWAAPGEPLVLPDSGEFVVKPVIGAGSMGVGRFEVDNRAQALAHGAALHADGLAVMVQPYVNAVDTAGEVALIHLDGRYSHCIRKAAMLARSAPIPAVSPADGPVAGLSSERRLFVSERISARAPTDEERTVAAGVLANVPIAADLLYARVDLVPGEDGPLLLELELTEPSLFLQYDDGAAGRLATAIATRAGTSATSSARIGR